MPANRVITASRLWTQAMSKEWKPNKRTVELEAAARPSRIRRQPAPISEAANLARNGWWESREWEIRLAIAGILFFAIAISAAVVDIGHVLGY